MSKFDQRKLSLYLYYIIGKISDYSIANSPQSLFQSSFPSVCCFASVRFNLVLNRSSHESIHHRTEQSKIKENDQIIEKLPANNRVQILMFDAVAFLKALYVSRRTIFCSSRCSEKFSGKLPSRDNCCAENRFPVGPSRTGEPAPD